jgi:hypothetical protein
MIYLSKTENKKLTKTSNYLPQENRSCTINVNKMLNIFLQVKYEHNRKQ